MMEPANRPYHLPIPAPRMGSPMMETVNQQEKLYLISPKGQKAKSVFGKCRKGEEVGNNEIVGKTGHNISSVFLIKKLHLTVIQCLEDTGRRVLLIRESILEVWDWSSWLDDSLVLYLLSLVALWCCVSRLSLSSGDGSHWASCFLTCPKTNPILQKCYLLDRIVSKSHCRGTWVAQ